MTIVQVTEWGEEHGLINSLPNSNSGDGFQHMTGSTKAKAEKQKKEDNRFVKARYMNNRGENERLEMTYCKYSGDKLLQYNLIPGRIYELPMGMVDQINESSLEQRSKVDDDRTAPAKKSGAAIKIHQLVPIAF